MTLPPIWGNLVDLAPRATSPPNNFTLRALVNWGTVIISLLGTLGSVIALFVPLPILTPGVGYYSVAGISFTIFIGVALLSLRDQYRRWKLYQRSSYHLHMLAHRLRDRLDPAKLLTVQAVQYIIGQPVKNPLNQLLYETLNDICEIFKSLVHSGSISVNLLIPVSETPGQIPSQLMVGLWSKPYDATTGARRARNTKGERFRSRLSIDASVAGKVFSTKHSVLVRDTRFRINPLVFDIDSRRTKGEKTFDYVRSLICVPVVLKDNPVFVLSVDCSKPRQFHTDYIDIARMGADLLALVCKLANVDPTRTQ